MRARTQSTAREASSGDPDRRREPLDPERGVALEADEARVGLAGVLLERRERDGARVQLPERPAVDDGGIGDVFRDADVHAEHRRRPELTGAEDVRAWPAGGSAGG